MSRKGKKRARAKYRQPMRPGSPTQSAGASAATVQSGAAPRSVSQARVGGDQALVRAVELSLGGQNQIVKQRGGRFVVQSTDPSIPLDRVPYFTKDLTRLLVVGFAMVVLLAVGSLTVPLIVK
ncbi:MAG TPA: hypothetical protein VGX27_02800 [Candidatus Dormibacteraeota bacterium]|nr:hypothetical protein [Candidatus Dormibacteraeota bacterium]